MVYDRYLAGAVANAVVPLVEEVAASLTAGSTVVDVGCGGGQQIRGLLDAAPGLRVTGVDPSKYELAAARRRLGERASLVRGSASALPLTSKLADATLSLCSIKHWPDPRQGLAECVRVTKPGGQILVAELDGTTTAREWRRFVATTEVPAPSRMVYATASHRLVVRWSITADQVTEMLSGLPVARVAVSRLDSTPLLVATAVRQA